MAKGRRTLKPRFWLILTAVVAVVAACVYSSQAYYLRLQNETLAELEVQRAGLMEKKAAQERQLDFMDTDEYIIREARDVHNLLMPGEILFEDGN